MKTKVIEVNYSAYVQVEVPDSWDEGEHEMDIIEMAIQQWEKYPDGTWDIVGEVD